MYFYRNTVSGVWKISLMTIGMSFKLELSMSGEKISLKVQELHDYICRFILEYNYIDLAGSIYQVKVIFANGWGDYRFSWTQKL